MPSQVSLKVLWMNGRVSLQPIHQTPHQHSCKKGLHRLKPIFQLRDQWMIRLGELSIGLSGIFMVRYSSGQELLGPMAWILLSLVAGLILHGVANIGDDDALAVSSPGSYIVMERNVLCTNFMFDETEGNHTSYPINRQTGKQDCQSSVALHSKTCSSRAA
jgi:hypothetical protein